MRVLHLCTSHAWGGLEIYTCTLMKELRDAGQEIYALCASGSKVEGRLKEFGIPTYVFPRDSVRSLSGVLRVKSLVRDLALDVLHVHFHRDIWPASLALRKHRSTNLFLTIHIGVIHKKDFFHRFIYKRVDGFFTSSPELFRILPERYPIDPSRVHYLPHGKRLTLYRSDERVRAGIRARYGIRPDEILVGTTIRIDPGKGVMDFVRSFIHIDPPLRERVKFMIVGEPTRRGVMLSGKSPYEPRSEAYLKEIQSFIAEHGLHDRLILTGFQKDPIEFLSAMDIFVYPSRDEMYSVALLDAMAMRLAVVAAASGGNVFQISDGVNGFLYRVADSEDIARKIERYILNADLRRKHGEKAREFVQKEHDMDAMIARLSEFYAKKRIEFSPID